MEVEQQALKVISGKKYQKQTWPGSRKISDGVQKSEISTSRRKKSAHMGKEKYDKRKVQCYCCKKFGQFIFDSWSNKEMKSL